MFVAYVIFLSLRGVSLISSCAYGGSRFFVCLLTFALTTKSFSISISRKIPEFTQKPIAKWINNGSDKKRKPCWAQDIISCTFLIQQDDYHCNCWSNASPRASLCWIQYPASLECVTDVKSEAISISLRIKSDYLRSNLGWFASYTITWCIGWQ